MKKVVAFLADGFETVEALCVIDLLRRAKVLVETVSIKEDKYVVSSHNIEVKADKSIDELDMSDADMIFLPGGPGHTRLLECETVMENVRDFVAREKLVGAICAAPSILGRIGALKGKKATCFPGYEQYLLEAIHCNDKAVRDGNIITGKGMGASMEFGLLMVEAMTDKKTADDIASSTQFA